MARILSALSNLVLQIQELYLLFLHQQSTLQTSQRTQLNDEDSKCVWLNAVSVSTARMCIISNACICSY